MTAVRAVPATENTGVAHVPTVRNAAFADLLAMLNAQQTRKIDMVVPAGKVKFTNGMLAVEGQELILEDDGFTDPNGLYWPTQQFDDQVAERLDIAPGYLRRLRHGRTDKREKTIAPPRLDLWDANANGLLAGRKPLVARQAVRGRAHPEVRVLREGVPADPRSFSSGCCGRKTGSASPGPCCPTVRAQPGGHDVPSSRAITMSISARIRLSLGDHDSCWSWRTLATAISRDVSFRALPAAASSSSWCALAAFAPANASSMACWVWPVVHRVRRA